jgi:hypothetical protein
VRFETEYSQNVQEGFVMRLPLGSPNEASPFHTGKVNGKRLWLSWCDTLANEGIAITREQFLVSFGKRNDSTLSQWLGAAAERIERIPDAKDELYRRLVRKTLLECRPFANLNRELKFRGRLPVRIRSSSSAAEQR